MHRSPPRRIAVKLPIIPRFPLVLVIPGEKTCLVCGETTMVNFCVRCGDEGPKDGSGPPPPRLVETLSYLREGEYIIQRI